MARDLDRLSRTRLSRRFILRDFLFSAHAAAHGIPNFPDDPAMVVRAGKALCSAVLEPIIDHFGDLTITFGYECRAAIERGMSPSRAVSPRSSNPHQWDRGTFGKRIYARVDILPFCVEDGAVSKYDFGLWVMHNLDIDLLMQWGRSNVFCITIGPKPRRVWIEWGSGADPRQIQLMGTDYWQRIYATLPVRDRPKYGPSATGGRLQWTK